MSSYCARANKKIDNVRGLVVKKKNATILELIKQFKKTKFTLNLSTRMYSMYNSYCRPPKNASKVESEDEEEDDRDLLEAKIVLRDVNMTGN